MFKKKKYYRYRYNKIVNFFEAQWIKDNGCFGEDYLSSGKPLGLSGKKLLEVLKSESYEWYNIEIQ